MKFLVVLLLSFFPSIGFAASTDLTEVILQTPRAVNKKPIIQAANRAISSAVYWEDEGKEFAMIGDAEGLAITKIFLDSKKVAQKLELIGRAQVGGFGWHSGYQKGEADCTISIERVNGAWPADGSSAEANCEITMDYGD